MITLAWYLLKVTICSGILYGYYYACLRNKIFHRWNRFYLIASVVLSLAAPLVKINIFQSSAAGNGTVVRMLHTITNSDEIVIEYNRNRGLHLSSENIIEVLYLSGIVAFMVIFLLALYKIYRLRKKYPETKFNGINFISTDAKGTPFSFFNSIFWNRAIDLNSKHGQQIFNHEIAHVKEKHSYDKVFMNVVLIFFWINPFFWLMQKELSMIHEFIADKDASEKNDINAFAEMILQTVYPGQQFSITNNFFHSPLKRRLLMFTKNKNSKVNYVSRLLVLPLTAVVFLAFTLKITSNSASHYIGKKITVVIDAGHGGSDNGIVENNINEKDVTLAIAKSVKELNTNKNLDIILSRANDNLLTPQDRIKFAEANKADLFISIHTDADEIKNTNSGLYVFIPKNDNSYLEKSKVLASAIVESFKNNYQLNVAKELQQREKGVWVLAANQFPSILIEAGFLTTKKDLNYLTKPENQQTIAKNILDGIEKYADESSKNNNMSGGNENSKISDSLPESLFIVDGKTVSKAEVNAMNPESIQSVNVLKGESAVKMFGEKGKNGVVEIKIKKLAANKENPTDINPNPVYFSNGKEISKDEMKQISPNNIESVNVLKGESAIKKYGDKAKDGAVEIILKPGSTSMDTIPDKLFTKVENEASFPGGQEAWTKYIISKIKVSVDSFTNKDFGTCLVRFIVNKDGTVSNVEATTMEDSHLAKVSIDAIKGGPKWIPASQNGQIVAAYRLQPVTLTNPDKK